MENKKQINWSDILSKFSSYEGSIAKFCNENGIKVHQFYYQRKKVKKDNSPVFHGIKVSEKNVTFPSNDKLALENILQIVISTC